MSDLEQALGVYFDIAGAQVTLMANRFEEEFLPAGASHTRKDSYQTRLSFLTEGFIRVWSETERRDVTQWVSGPQEFVTDLSCLMFGQPARNHLQAITDCRMFSISMDGYRELPRLIPEWNHLEKLFMGKCFIQLETRVWSFLTLSAEERYRAFMEQKPHLFQAVPQQYLASLLGMTPETFSRIRRKVVS